MTRVAIVLPGRSYGADLPALSIPIDVLRSKDFAVSAVDYRPEPWPDWRRAEAGDWSEVTDVVVPQLPDLADASDVMVVAKSMGTSVVGAISNLLPTRTRAIWITPLFGDPDVTASVLRHRWTCLSVYGTGDMAHDPAGQASVTAACRGFELQVDGADHSLEVNDDKATNAGFDALRRAVDLFV